MLDRGFDRRELFGPLVKHDVAFVVRQRGDRTVHTANGRDVSVDTLVAGQVCPRPQRWPNGGVSVTVEVWLPEVGPDPFLLVVGWRVPGSERSLVLLVSPAARRPGRPGRWYVQAYHRRWDVEDATRGWQQQFAVEEFFGPLVDGDPPAVVAGSLGLLAAEFVGRGLLRATPDSIDDAPLAAEKEGNLLVQLDCNHAPRIALPQTKPVTPHWVNSSEFHLAVTNYCDTIH